MPQTAFLVSAVQLAAKASSTKPPAHLRHHIAHNFLFASSPESTQGSRKLFNTTSLGKYDGFGFCLKHSIGSQNTLACIHRRSQLSSHIRCKLFALAPPLDTLYHSNHKRKAGGRFSLLSACRTNQRVHWHGEANHILHCTRCFHFDQYVIFWYRARPCREGWSSVRTGAFLQGGRFMRCFLRVRARNRWDSMGLE